MQNATRLMALLLVPVLWACGDDSSPLRGATAEGATVQARDRGAAAARPSAGRIDVGYLLGSPDAPVVVVEFSDFGCPYCGRFAIGTFPDLHREYIEAGLVRWRYVPVSFGFAGGALMGAAAECAGRIAGDDGFWRAHELLYRHQTALRGADAFDRLLAWFDEAGFDRARIESCVREPGTASALEANNRVAEEWLVRGTPTFLVNGAPMSGALPTEFFFRVLDTALDPSGM
jgi:protein-disulfide isomerase